MPVGPKGLAQGNKSCGRIGQELSDGTEAVEGVASGALPWNSQHLDDVKPILERAAAKQACEALQTQLNGAVNGLLDETQ